MLDSIQILISRNENVYIKADNCCCFLCKGEIFMKPKYDCWPMAKKWRRKLGGGGWRKFQFIPNDVASGLYLTHTHTHTLQPMLTDTHTGMHVHSLSLSHTHTHTHARTHSVASDPFIFPSFSNEPAFKMTDFKDEVF